MTQNNPIYSGVCTVICPRELQPLLLGARAFPRGRFAEKGGAIATLRYTYDDRDVLRYAAEAGCGFSQARVLFQQASRLLDEKPSETLAPVEKLFAVRDQLLKEGLLRRDELAERPYRSDRIFVVGYAPEVDTDLFGALLLAGIEEGESEGSYTLASTPEMESLTVAPASPATVQRFDDSVEETVRALSDIAGYISVLDTSTEEGKREVQRIAVLCPSSYISTLRQSQSLFGLRFSLPLSSPHTSPAVKAALDAYVSEGRTDLVSALLGDGPSFAHVASRLLEGISLLESLRDIQLSPELRREYLDSLIGSPATLGSEATGISVYTSLESVPLRGLHLWILGFSSDLIASARDRDLIPDSLKPSCTLSPDGIHRNLGTERSLKRVLGGSDVRWMSRADSDSFKQFEPVFLAPAMKDWFIEEKEVTDKGYTSYGIERVEGTRSDLSLLISLGRDRYDRIFLTDPFVTAAIQAAPESGERHGRYSPEFSSDPDTVEYFRKLFSGKIKLSYSSINSYVNNPFAFYCEQVLKIKGGDSLITLIGTYLHSAVEKRDSFDPDAELENLLADQVFPIGGASREECEFFIRRAYENYSQFVKDRLIQAETDAGMRLIQPAGALDREEFHGVFDLGQKVEFNMYTDAIYTYQGEDSGKAVIVDYKTSTTPTNYVNSYLSLLGRKNQLPFYVLFYPQLRKKYPELAPYPQVSGAYIVSLTNKDETPLEKGVFTGFSLEGTEELSQDFTAVQMSNRVRTKEQGKEDSKDLASPAEEVIYKSLLQLRASPDRVGDFPAQVFDSLTTFGDPNVHNHAADDDRMEVLASYLTLNQTVHFLRNGRLKDEEGNPVWFPYYPFVRRYSDTPHAFDTYRDISFTPGTKHVVQPDVQAADWTDWTFDYDTPIPVPDDDDDGEDNDSDRDDGTDNYEEEEA